MPPLAPELTQTLSGAPLVRARMFTGLMLGLAGLTSSTNASGEPFVITDVAFARHSITAGAGEASLADGDFDGDDHTDVVIASQADAELVLFRGDGSGSLREARRFAAGPNPTDVRAADVDADGHLDLVVTNHDTTTLTLLRGNGRGVFTHGFGSPLTIDVDPHPHVTLPVDLDGDGDFDLIIDDRNRNGLRIYTALQPGVFATASRLVPMGGDPYLGMAAGDIDGDGWPDLVTPNGNEVAVARATGERPFDYARAESLAAAQPFAVALADLDNDGDLDLLVGLDGMRSGVEIHYGDGSGKFAKYPVTIRLAAGGKGIATGDINCDGVDDALAVSWNRDAVIVLGGPELGAAPVPLAGIDHPWGITISDLNGDGCGDFLIADGMQERVAVFVSRRIAEPARDD